MKGKQGQKNWQKLEVILKNLSDHMKNALFYQLNNNGLQIEYYFCQSVMELVLFLRNQTKTSELGAQHHTLKILFNFMKYGETGIIEFPIDGNRADIYLTHENQVIEVKKISDMTFHKLYKKILGVIESESSKADILWVFYFYKLLEPSSIAPNCQYLLTFISIDLIEVEPEALKWDLSHMIEESKAEIAQKLKIIPELIFPLENLIKVDDLERELAEEKQKVLERDQEIANKDQEIAILKAKLQEYNKKNKKN
jgi:hypothetical protein